MKTAAKINKKLSKTKTNKLKCIKKKKNNNNSIITRQICIACLLTAAQ